MPSRRAGRPPTASGEDGRASILKSARILLAERGPSRVSLRDVAELAGVKPPLVHYHFGNKAELFEAVMFEVSGEMRDRLLSVGIVEGSPEERIRRFVGSLVDTLAADPYAVRLVMELAVFPDDERTRHFVEDFAAPNFGALSQILADGAGEGGFRELDPELVTPAIVGMCVFYFLASPMTRRQFGIDPLEPSAVARYAELVADLLVNGLRGARDE